MLQVVHVWRMWWLEGSGFANPNGYSSAGKLAWSSKSNSLYGLWIYYSSYRRSHESGQYRNLGVLAPRVWGFCTFDTWNIITFLHRQLIPRVATVAGVMKQWRARGLDGTGLDYSGLLGKSSSKI